MVPLYFLRYGASTKSMLRVFELLANVTFWVVSTVYHNLSTV